MLANNETGVLQPVGEVAALARRYDALVHCDAVQALGKIPLSFASLGLDVMIDFATPQSTMERLASCVERNIAMAIGTIL